MYQAFRKLPELAALLLLVIIGLGFFAVTDPAKLPPVVLIFGFGILFGIIYCVVRLGAKVLGLRGRLSKGRYNGVIAAATGLPVVLLALQSLGQLTVRDIITMVVMAGAGYFYISRMYGDPDTK